MQNANLIHFVVKWQVSWRQNAYHAYTVEYVSALVFWDSSVYNPAS